MPITRLANDGTEKDGDDGSTSVISLTSPNPLHGIALNSCLDDSLCAHVLD